MTQLQKPERGHEAVTGAWPVLRPERTWGATSLFSAAASAAVATWVFIIGGFVSFYLPAGIGTVAMVAGALVGILLVVLAVLPASARYGIESVSTSKPQFGVRGAYLAVLMAYASILGWNILLMIFLGRATATILVNLGVIAQDQRSLVVLLSGVLGTAFVWFLLRGGPRLIGRIAPYIASAVLLLAAWLLWTLVTQVGWSRITAAEPAYATGIRQQDFMLGFEVLVAVNLSWWPYAGAMIRLSSGAKKALWPIVFGLGIPVALVSLVGLYAGLVVPESEGDPTVFLDQLGGPVTGLIALAFVVVANLGTTMVGSYGAAVGIQAIPALQRRLSWNAATATALIPVGVVVAFFSGWFADNIGTFMAFLGVLFAPLCGIQIVDYFFFRRQRLDVASLYIESRSGSYFFWGGFNPAALLAMVAGFATYIYLLDPVWYVPRFPFQILAASIPSAGVAALVFGLLTQLWIIPSGRGGYRRREPENATATDVPD